MMNNDCNGYKRLKIAKNAYLLPNKETCEDLKLINE